MPADPDPPASARPERVLELERGFRRAGLPLFIEGYSATTDVFNRAVPLLGLVFLGEMLGAANFEWSPLANLAALAGALAILLGGVALVNARNGLPPFGLPQRVGKTELAAFVILPATLPLIFGGQWRSALVIAAANLLLLAAIYGVVGYGLAFIVRWVLGRMAGQIRSSLGSGRQGAAAAGDLRAALVHDPGDVADLPRRRGAAVRGDDRAVRRPGLALPRGPDCRRGAAVSSTTSAATRRRSTAASGSTSAW